MRLLLLGGDLHLETARSAAGVHHLELERRHLLDGGGRRGRHCDLEAIGVVVWLVDVDLGVGGGGLRSDTHTLLSSAPVREKQ